MTIVGSAVLAVSLFATRAALAEEAAPATEEAPAAVDPVLQGEIRYVEALLDWGFADFANEVIDATKKKWPESEAQLFALEIRRLLLEGKFDEAEGRIAKLGNRTSPKYWAARLEVANNYFGHNKREECSKIYDEFFTNNKKPGKELRPLMRDAMYNWIQILKTTGRMKEAAETFDSLLTFINPKASEDDDNAWCSGACEAAELYLSLAAEQDAKARGNNLKAAKKYIDKLLWRQDMLIYFGRAIAMKAYWELLNGSVEKAQAVISDYKENLQYIHNELVKADPTGAFGWLRQSPMPQCRYLMAQKYWKEAQDEFKKPKRDEEKVKSLLFGAKGKSGKRNGEGAFNHAVNVYLRFPESVWAPAAGRIQREISAFCEKNFGKAPGVNATPEQERNVLVAQFKNAGEKFAERDWKGAIDDYYTALRSYPEEDLSIEALRNIATSYLNLADDEQDAKKKDAYLLSAAAVEGYLASRFGGSRTVKKNRQIMINAGNAAISLATRERDSGRRETAEDIFRTFITCYTRHPDAARSCLSLAYESQKKADDLLKEGGSTIVQPTDSDEVRATKLELKAETDKLYREALSWYAIIEAHYKKKKEYSQALSYMSSCYSKLGESEKAVACLEEFTNLIDEKKRPLARFQSELAVASLHMRIGATALEEANALRRAGETEEAEKKAAAGTDELKKSLSTLNKLAPRAQTLVADPNLDETSKAKALSLRESALYTMADGWSRLTYPADKVEAYRKQSIANFEEYVKEFPKGRYAKRAYMRLGSHYCVNGEVEKGKESLSRLREHFPDSTEAKKALPQLAKSLIDYAATLDDNDPGRKTALEEARKTYREMIDNNKGQYTPTDYMRAAETLVTARDWSLAATAYDKAESLSGTNAAYRTVVARSRLGKANIFLEQNEYGLAREALDDFMNDEKLSRMMIVTNACDLLATVAIRQGEQEEDARKRARHYGAAMGAIKKLRNYWKSNKDIADWQRDRVELMSSDLSISRMKAETMFGNNEASTKACNDAVRKLEGFIKAKSAGGKIDMEALGREDRANLERAYAGLVDTLARTGEEQINDVAVYATAYKYYFPKGRHLSDVENALKAAVAAGAAEPTEAQIFGGVEHADATPVEENEDEEAEAETPAAETPAEKTPAAEPAAEAPAAETPAAETPAEEPEPAAEEPAAEEPAEEEPAEEEPAAEEPAE